MKIAILTYTHWRDMHRAHQLHKNIPNKYIATNGMPIETTKFWIIESKDEMIKEIVKDREILVRNFDRGYSLNGSFCCIGMTQVYKELFAGGFDAIIKLDADTALLDFEIFFENFSRGEEIVGSFRYPTETPPLAFNGCCYAFSKSVAQAFLNEQAFTKAVRENKEHCPEDLFFHLVFKNALPYARRVNIDKGTVYMCCRPNVGAFVPIMHFGYVSNETIAKKLREVEENREKAGVHKRNFGFSIKEAEEFVKAQSNIDTKRKIEPYGDAYDETGAKIQCPVPPAGSVLVGYDSNDKPVYKYPEKIYCPNELSPLPKNMMKNVRSV